MIIPGLKIVASVAIGSVGSYIGLVGMMTESTFESVGGWSFALMATYYLWSELKRERLESKEQRIKHEKDMEIVHAQADQRHRAVVQLCTAELAGIRKNLETRPCIARMEDEPGSLNSLPHTEGVTWEQQKNQ